MIIKGFQKTTLLDYPEKVACTVFTGGCNFRCPFCHNGDMVEHSDEIDTIPEEDVFAYLKKRKGIVDGVCITGGEPLLHDVEPFIRKIKSEGFLVKLDTNGSFPDKLKHLVNSGIIDYVAMDIKNCQNKYSWTAGVDIDIDKIKESVAFLIEGNIEYEFRTTVVKDFHNAEDFINIGNWIKGARKYYLQSFVDSDYVIKKGLESYKKGELESFADSIRPYVAHVGIRGV